MAARTQDPLRPLGTVLAALALVAMALLWPGAALAQEDSTTTSTATPTTADAATSETSSTSGDADTSDVPWVLIVAGLVALIVLILVLVAVRRRQVRNPEAGPAPSAPPPPWELRAIDLYGDASVVADLVRTRPEPGASPASVQRWQDLERRIADTQAGLRALESSAPGSVAEPAAELRTRLRVLGAAIATDRTLRTSEQVSLSEAQECDGVVASRLDDYRRSLERFRLAVGR